MLSKTRSGIGVVVMTAARGRERRSKQRFLAVWVLSSLALLDQTPVAAAASLSSSREREKLIIVLRCRSAGGEEYNVVIDRRRNILQWNGAVGRTMIEADLITTDSYYEGKVPEGRRFYSGRRINRSTLESQTIFGANELSFGNPCKIEDSLPKRQI